MYRYKMEIISTNRDHFWDDNRFGALQLRKKDFLISEKRTKNGSEKTVYEGTALAGNVKAKY